jgi:hypothetical protein
MDITTTPQLQFSKFRLMAHIEANGQVKTYSQLVDDEALLPALEMDAWVTMARLAIGPGTLAHSDWPLASLVVGQ